MVDCLLQLNNVIPTLGEKLSSSDIGILHLEECWYIINQTKILAQNDFKRSVKWNSKSPRKSTHCKISLS